MHKIEIISTGLIYRNPLPHVYSRQAIHPSVLQLPCGDLLAGMSIGEAFESPDSKAYLARSCDNGETWELEQKLYEGSEEYPSSEGVRISLVDKGEVAAYLLSANRTRKDAGLTNPDNLGFVETEFLLTRSADGGHTWERPANFDPPLIGPAFEICCPIKVLRDGRWILPTQTWMGWDGYCPNGFKMVAFVSEDRGKTWPGYMDVMSDDKNEIIYWESKIVEFGDERLLAAAWAYDRIRKYDLENCYAVSSDKGKTFSRPMSTGLKGQTMTPMLIKNDKILTIYRRIDKPGLWANISSLEKDKWINEFEKPLWGSDQGGLVSHGDNMARNFHALKFGAPSVIELKDSSIFIAFWCVEDCVYNIRWIKLKVESENQI